MSSPPIHPPQGSGQPPRPIALIGACVGVGGPQEGTREGPCALYRAGLIERLAPRVRLQAVRWVGCGRQVPCDWGTEIGTRTGIGTQAQAKGLDRVGISRSERAVLAARAALEVDRAVSDSLAAGALPVVLGGDHSIALGTWGAVARSLRPGGALGLVWIDAHLDAHSPQTSPSGMPHGMPLAGLLGNRDLRPEHLVLVGARSWESAEQAFLSRLGVRIMPMPEIGRRGLVACLSEAIAIASRQTAGWGLSLDLDAIDPEDLPATGTPVLGTSGLSGEALREALSGLARQPGLRALEVVEYLPARDSQGASARYVLDLLESCLAGAPDMPDVPDVPGTDARTRAPP